MISTGPTSTLPKWSIAKIERWLTFLAEHIIELQTPDLAWWQLHRSLNRRMSLIVFVLFVWITAMVVSALSFGPLIGSPLISPVGIAVGLTCGATAALTARFGTVPGLPVRLELIKGRRTVRREMVRSAVVGGLAPGLVVAAGFTIAQNLVVGVVAGVMAFGALGLAAGILRWSTPAERATAVNPRTVPRTDRSAALFWGAMVTLMTGGFVYAIMSVSHRGQSVMPPALICGAFLGLGFMLGSAWSWLQATHLLLVLRGRLPLRLMRFLQDAHERGTLRVAGAVYQFRHRRLQNYLAGRDFLEPAETTSPDGGIAIS